MPKSQPTDSRKRRRRRVLRWGFCTLVLVLASPGLAMFWFGAWASAEKADVIVVPGAALRDGGSRLSWSLERRMDRAIELFHEGYAPMMIVSGGGEGAWSEADAMARYAIERGVPSNCVALDRGGLTTRATADNVSKVLKNDERVLVVSQWIHLPRIRLAFAQNGVDTCGEPAIGVRAHLKNSYYIREYVGLPAYLLRLEGHRDQWHEIVARPK